MKPISNEKKTPAIQTTPHMPDEACANETEKKITREMATAAFLMCMDGYSNAAAFLGEQSPLLSAGTFVRSGLTNNLELLTTTYRVNWIAKKIIDMPSEDMTREWYTMNTEMEEEDLLELKELEAKHSIKQEITNAIRWARLYGGSLALMVVDDPLNNPEGDFSKPLDIQGLLPGSFQGLLVLDRSQGIEPSLELVSDLEDPDYGLPMYYHVNIQTEENQSFRIHHSRVLRFIGRELPSMETVAENYWGASELEHCWDELQKRAATSANIAQLVFQANITTLKMGDFGTSLVLGSERTQNSLMQAVANENRLRTSYGVQIMSNEDSMENHPYNFTGLAEIYEAFMMDMAGAAEIPATKLFGRSPQGMNATGESDLRNYYDMITQKQEQMLRPALEKLLPVMAISCWGFLPQRMEIVFNPVMTSSPAEQAALSQNLSREVIDAFQCGLISREQAQAELKARGEKAGLWGNI
jgi:phage-related protein (TIGR01555 family)